MATGTITNLTFWPSADTVQRKWHLVDARDQVLGRMASKIATLLTGKGKPFYTPSVDCGDFVVLVNASQVRLTGDKLEQKHIFHHTGFSGGARLESYKLLFKDRPERLVYLAVKRMLPRKKITSRQILRLKIYRDESHPHAVQNPEKLTI